MVAQSRTWEKYKKSSFIWKRWKADHSTNPQTSKEGKKREQKRVQKHTKTGCTNRRALGWRPTGKSCRGGHFVTAQISNSSGTTGLNSLRRCPSALPLLASFDSWKSERWIKMDKDGMILTNARGIPEMPLTLHWEMESVTVLRSSEFFAHPMVPWHSSSKPEKAGGCIWASHIWHHLTSSDIWHLVNAPVNSGHPLSWPPTGRWPAGTWLLSSFAVKALKAAVTFAKKNRPGKNFESIEIEFCHS